MAQKIECETCGKTFNAEEGLEMHAKAKHSKPSKKQAAGITSAQKKRTRNWLIFLIVVLAIGAGVFYLSSNVKVLPPTRMGGHSEAIPSSHVLKEPMPLAIQKHMLEHADGEDRPGVIINYNCEDFECEPELITKLESFAQKYDYVYVAPFKGMSVKIALTKLGKLETMDEYDENTIESFITSG